ncbi:tRNA-dihydrouridine synthase family protein [Treponema sp.]
MPPFLYLAPLHGITNRIFRKVYFRHFSGVDAVLAPFILSAERAQLKASHFKDLIPPESFGIPVIPQILSNDAPSFIATSRRLVDEGYKEINWNLGCPFPMVANKKRGSGLLAFPEEIDRFLHASCSQLAAPLSVKVRLGRNSADEFEALVPIFNRYPLRNLIIHPRIGIQMYEGRVDLESFEKAISALGEVPVYNGDILDAAGFAVLQERFPKVSQWMIGRGALCDPFLPARIKGLPNKDELKVLRSFHDELFESYRESLNSPKHALDKMKEIWSYLGASFSGGEKALKALRKATGFEAYAAAVDILFIVLRTM